MYIYIHTSFSYSFLLWFIKKLLNIVTCPSYVYISEHCAIYQKPKQYCESILLQKKKQWRVLEDAKCLAGN